jgi:putative ABC transport system permease protein
MLALLVAVSVVAGAYPAFVLASFRPSAATRARSTGRAQTAVRNVLVALQFAIVVAVLIATLVIYRQTAFGLRESLRQVENPTVLLSTRCSDAIKDAMTRVPGVLEAACTGSVPQAGGGSVGPIRYRDSRQLVIGGLSHRLLQAVRLRPVAGRFFSDDFGTDGRRPTTCESRRAIVINETGVRLLGFPSPRAAVGEIVSSITSRGHGRVHRRARRASHRRSCRLPNGLGAQRRVPNGVLRRPVALSVLTDSTRSARDARQIDRVGANG